MSHKNDTFDIVLRMRNMMYSSKDFENLWFLYQTEGAPQNISIESFCEKNGIDYPTFNKWFRSTHKGIYPIEITNEPSKNQSEVSGEGSTSDKEESSIIGHYHPRKSIKVTIQFPDGMKVVKNVRGGKDIKDLIERLEVVLC